MIRNLLFFAALCLVLGCDAEKRASEERRAAYNTMLELYSSPDVNQARRGLTNYVNVLMSKPHVARSNEFWWNASLGMTYARLYALERLHTNEELAQSYYLRSSNFSSLAAIAGGNQPIGSPEERVLFRVAGEDHKIRVRWRETPELLRRWRSLGGDIYNELVGTYTRQFYSATERITVYPNGKYFHAFSYSDGRQYTYSGIWGLNLRQVGFKPFHFLLNTNAPVANAEFVLFEYKGDHLQLNVEGRDYVLQREAQTSSAH